jgi:hypothetical protein
MIRTLALLAALTLPGISTAATIYAGHVGNAEQKGATYDANGNLTGSYDDAYPYGRPYTVVVSKIKSAGYTFCAYINGDKNHYCNNLDTHTTGPSGSVSDTSKYTKTGLPDNETEVFSAQLSAPKMGSTVITGQVSDTITDPTADGGYVTNTIIYYLSGPGSVTP